MKKMIIVTLMLCTFISYAQKENGTVYIEHPTIDVVEEFVKASIAGDKTKMASYLTEDFKAYNGTSNKTNDQGMDKEAFLNNQMVYFNQLDYYARETYPGSYADAIEYKKDNKDGEVWVQTWDVLKGMQKDTGVKINAAAHRLYTLTKNHEIKTIISYGNDNVLNEIGLSFTDRTNGKIYNHHDNINTIRKAMYAFENGDIDKCLSYYSDDATFYDINETFGESSTKAETKTNWQQFLNAYEIVSIDMIGYPDYLEYEMGEGREVLAWWNFHLIRKSDQKKLEVPFHLSNGFDAEGKIISEMEYYSQTLLTAK
ncbi:nuclear transport factor 2 family protein [Winogradskyella bathintestinalis]|uniref:Nuclear transport factor 2 family protein n=1 Tax=Winogradskyella bathintestinalis TaxID=3035208 RepID=A0ABT7ZVA8_9FLAO|nr:nuclear transport factor 2 family protein [Winogradskyella bathintestinalis]MDN3492925.1 nuclear transport factor 2 family protein [Winogradskyella bathintestinalis]